MTNVEPQRISNSTLAGLILAIAASDVLANVLTPEWARLPVKAVILAGFLVWARRAAGLSRDELGLGHAHLGAAIARNGQRSFACMR